MEGGNGEALASELRLITTEYTENWKAVMKRPTGAELRIRRSRTKDPRKPLFVANNCPWLLIGSVSLENQ